MVLDGSKLSVRKEVMHVLLICGHVPCVHASSKVKGAIVQ